MKNIQTGILKILLLFIVSFIAQQTQAQIFSRRLAYADSLFRVKQYTQSLKIYDEVLAAKQYSPSMLLKMAFIHEGLGKASKSLYYLNLYYLATGDDQTLLKMQELAARSKLQGYENPDTDQFWYHVNKYGYLISLLLANVVLFTLAWIYTRRLKSKKTMGEMITLVIFLVLLAVNVNYPMKDSTVMIASGNTYLMSGPSAGANVIGVVNEGHKLRMLNKKDVWLEVEWLDQPVYVKENRVTHITL